MKAVEAKEIIARMEKDARKKYTGPAVYENSYILGAMLAKFEFLLIQSKFKFKNFDDTGNYKFFFEK